MLAHIDFSTLSPLERAVIDRLPDVIAGGLIGTATLLITAELLFQDL